MLDLLKRLGDFVFIHPIRSLYFLGPSVGGIGGWGGLNHADICAHLTQVPASHWTVFSSGCEELLQRKFTSILVVSYCSIYLWLVYKFLSYLCFRYFVFGPFVQEIKTILPHKPEKIQDE
jgi:hypothetical protein